MVNPPERIGLSFSQRAGATAQPDALLAMSGRSVANVGDTGFIVSVGKEGLRRTSGEPPKAGLSF